MSEPTFRDAVRLARGCKSYGGGHHTDGMMNAYQHGIQTVINVLEAVEQAGYDMQTSHLWHEGAPATRPIPHAEASARAHIQAAHKEEK